MISLHSIWAIMIRYFYLWRSDYNTLLGGFYWPLLDILIWGFLGSWIEKSNMTEFTNYQTTALTAIILWQIIARGSNILISVFNEELWSNNLVNVFTLPLKTAEYIIGIIIFYMIMICLITLFCMSVIPILYTVSLWAIFSTFLIFLIPCLISGIWLGFMSLSIIATLGKRGADLGYIVSWFLLPFSAAYYPVSVLPAWAQTFTTYLPVVYLFTGMRNYLMLKEDPTYYLIKGSLLGIVYATCSIILFLYCFNRSKKNGLAGLTD